MSATYAGILGSLAFVVILIRGAIHGSGADSVLLAGLIGLIVFAAAGYVAGRVAELVVIESVTRQFQNELKNQETRKVAEANG